MSVNEMQAVQIPTFVDPNLFWIIKEEDIATIRHQIDDNLAKLNQKVRIKPHVGQIVCVKHQAKWKRALIKHIISMNNISCWLLDYGMLCTTSEVYNLPLEVSGPLPLAKRASLHNVVALNCGCNDLLKVTYTAELTYDTGNIEKCKEHLENASKIYFYVEKIIDSILCGYIKLQKCGSNETYNLIDILIYERSISIDPSNYQKTFYMEKPEFPIEFLNKLAFFDQIREVDFFKRLYPSDNLLSDKSEPVFEKLGAGSYKDILLPKNYVYNSDEGNNVSSGNEKESSNSNLDDHAPKISKKIGGNAEEAKPLTSPDSGTSSTKAKRLSSARLISLLNQRSSLESSSAKEADLLCPKPEGVNVSQSDPSLVSKGRGRGAIKDILMRRGLLPSSAGAGSLGNDDTAAIIEGTGAMKIEEENKGAAKLVEDNARFTTEIEGVTTRQSGGAEVVQEVSWNEIRSPQGSVDVNIPPPEYFRAGGGNKYSSQRSTSSSSTKSNYNKKKPQRYSNSPSKGHPQSEFKNKPKYEGANGRGDGASTENWDSFPPKNDGPGHSRGKKGRGQPSFRNPSTSTSVSRSSLNTSGDSESSTYFSDSNSNKQTTREESSTDIDSDDSSENIAKCILGCKCKSCLSWEKRGLDAEEDFDFLDSEKKPVEVKKVIEKPELLLESSNGSQDSMTSNIRHATLYNSVMIHGNPIPDPCLSVASAPFHENVQSTLRYHRIRDPKPMQACVWPSIMRKQNVFMIGGKECGKTMSYIPALASWMLEKDLFYKNLPDLEKGPLAVVICSGVDQAQDVNERFSKVKPKIQQVCITPPIEKHIKVLKNPCDVLIATPITLVTLIREGFVNFKRVCHLVIEDAHIVLDKYKQQITTLLKLVQSMLVNRSCRLSVQLILTAEEWTVSIESLLKTLKNVPVVFISQPIEAAVYGRAHFQPHFLEAHLKLDTLKSILKDKYMIHRTIVVCNDDEECSKVEELLQLNGIPLVTANDSMTTEELDEAESTWQRSVCGKLIVLVCTHDALTISLGHINSANLVIHFSLPSESWSAFRRRFSCLLNNFNSPLEKLDRNHLKAKVHMFIDEKCNKQFPRVLSFLQRIGATMPESFISLQKKYSKLVEEQKIQNHIIICPQFKMFGECQKDRCIYRHSFSSTIDDIPNLPKAGTIHFTISYIHDVAHYTVKLIECIHPDGTKETFPDKLKYISSKLTENLSKIKEIVDDAKVGDIYAYPVSNLQFERVSVIKLSENLNRITRKPTHVRVRFLDTGAIKDLMVADLYEIPSFLKKIPPQGINVILANCLPPERDNSFSIRSLSIFKKMLESSDYKNDKAYFSAQICLQVGTDFWVDEMQLKQKLDLAQITITKFEIKNFIEQRNIACFDEKPLKLLYKMCEEVGYDIPDYASLRPKTQSKQEGAKNTATPRWAFLEVEGDDYNAVYLQSVVSPSQFYVSLRKFNDLLEKLQLEIQAAIAHPLYPVLAKIEAGIYCLANFKSSGEYLRAYIVSVFDNESSVECFFVDTGDIDLVLQKDVKYLCDDFITKLPFQAIECSLYGLKPIGDEVDWPKEAIDCLIHFKFEPGTDYFRELFAKVFFVDKSEATGGQKYCVTLVDTFQSRTYINKVLHNTGIVEAIEGENLNEALPNLNELKLDIYDPEEEPEEEEEWEVKETEEITNKELVDYLDDLDNVVQNQNECKSEENIEKAIQEVALRFGMSKEELEAKFEDLDSWDLEGSFITTETLAEQDNKRVLISRDTANDESVVPPSQLALEGKKYYAPKAVWRQTDKFVKIDIHLSVENPIVSVVRNKFFVFSAEYDSKEYRLSFTLFDKVKPDVQFACGNTIRVTLEKEEPKEWLKLHSGKVKYRNIIYDVASEIKPEKKRLFLQLDSDEEANRDKNSESDSDDIFIEEFYSDVDYDTSDYEVIDSDG